MNEQENNKDEEDEVVEKVQEVDDSTKKGLRNRKKTDKTEKKDVCTLSQLCYRIVFVKCIVFLFMFRNWLKTMPNLRQVTNRMVSNKFLI